MEPDYEHLARILAREYTKAGRDVVTALRNLDVHRKAENHGTSTLTRDDYIRHAAVLGAAFDRTKNVAASLRALDHHRERLKNPVIEPPLRSAEVPSLIACGAHHFDVPEPRIRDAGNRHPDVIRCRWALIKIMRDQNWSMPKIGAALGMDHSSVANGLNKLPSRPEILEAVPKVVGAFRHVRELEAAAQRGASHHRGRLPEEPHFAEFDR